MTPQETLKICRLAKAASPAQAMDEYTPELWAMVLAPFRYVDAEQAITELAGDQEWIHVSHIKKRIKRIRHERVLAYGMLPEPPSDVDALPGGYSKWHYDTVRAIGDGALTTITPQLPPGPRGPWDEEQERAVAKARLKTVLAEARKQIQPAPDVRPVGRTTTRPRPAYVEPPHTPRPTPVPADDHQPEEA